MATVKSSAENLTLNADGANNDIIFQSNGSNIATLDQAGLFTATSFAGSGANLTGIATPITALNNATANELVSVGSTTTELDAESNLTFDGSTLAVTGAITGTSFTGAVTGAVTGNVAGNITGSSFTFPNSSLSESSVNMTLNITAGNNDFYVSSGGTPFVSFKGLNKDLWLTGGDVVIDTAGKGIVLGATSNVDANTLDDYEEGSWTPSFANGTPTYTTTYARTGYYTKIGNVCQVWMELYMGSISFADVTASLDISGLPFAAHASHGATFGVAMSSNVIVSNMYSHGVTYNSLGAGDNGILSMSPRIAANASKFILACVPFSNSACGFMKNAAFHNGSGLAVGLTYRTA